MAAGATDQPSAWDRTLSAINDTTPFALASEGQQRAGWFHGAWDGIKRIWNEGRSDLYLSGYYWHTPWGFSDEDRERYDDLGLGAGYGRSLTDAKGNQRLLYAIVAQDSFEKPMYMAGYGWLARWRIPGNLRLGAGYSITILSNSTATDYIPIPVPVPLASIGTENASIYAAYMNHIVYFFARVSF
jgi:palmitoyl transferase